MREWKVIRERSECASAVGRGGKCYIELGNRGFTEFL
jgi:hypothetical protein